MFKLSQRAENLKPSATLAITAKAKQLKAQGVDVIGFGAGEPDFSTPAHIVDVAIDSLRKGEHHYTPVGGTPALKEAIVASVKRDYGLDYEAGCATASCGAKHTLFNLFMALIDAGDQVIVPAPYWVSYPEQVALAGGEPVIVPASEENDFLLDAASLEAAVTPATKALVLNSPSNPTGSMYSREQLGELAEVIRKGDYLVVSDDIYHKLVYGDERFTSILEVAPDLADRVVIVNGVSKTYAMTGWRLGFAVGPKPLISAMEKIQGQSTSNPTSFIQSAVIEAITGDQSCLGQMLSTFDKRRRLMVEGLNAIDGVSCAMPSGAFYAFPNVSSFYGSKSPGGEVIGGSLEMAAYLLDQARIAVVPGQAFGSDENLRLSYATGEEQISEGLGRMARALAELG